ncbi:MAG: hypothetical protein ACW98U_16990 [Candidatus Thorarchaeota archaeon]|jgi:hypothetical protein
MSGDEVTPPNPDPHSQQFIGRVLKGWEEIRNALLFVEELRKQQKNELARVEVYEYSENSSLNASFRSIKELDDFLESRFRTLLLEGRDDNDISSTHMDVMSEVRGEVQLE